MIVGRRLLVVIATGLLTAGLLAAPAAAGGRTTWHVAPSGSGGGSCATPHANTIQAAIDAAAPGDRILVCPGTYREWLTVDKDGLTIRATKPWQAVIRPPAQTSTARRSSPAGESGILNGPFVLSVVGADGVTIQWLRFIAPVAGVCGRIGAMIDVRGGSQDVLIRSNRMRSKRGASLTGPCGYDSGIVVRGGSTGRVANNLVADFGQWGGSGGLGGIVVAEEGTFARVWRNSVRFRHRDEGPGALTGIGIQVGYGAAARVSRNRLVGLASASQQGPAVVGTPLLPVAIYISVGGTAPVHDVIVRRNRVRYAGTGIALEGSRGVIVGLNRVLDVASDGISVGNNSAGARILSNIVRRSGWYGIRVDDPGVVRGNVSRGAGEFDCFDSTGNPPLSTWVNNTGRTSSPDGLCSLPRP